MASPSGHQSHQDYTQAGAGGELTAAEEAFVQKQAPLATTLTSGTLTASNVGELRSVWHKYSWNNTMVLVNTGTTANVAICTLPAKTIVSQAHVVVNTAATVIGTLTVSVGRVATGYTDYIVRSDVKAAANTTYSAAALQDFPTASGTTLINVQFRSEVDALSTAATSTGSIYLLTATLP